MKENDYQEIHIPKKRGGCRRILIPSDSLKRTQREILKLLTRQFRERHNVYGLCPRGSYVRHARVHSHSRFVFLIDLEDAFTSVPISKLKTILEKGLCHLNTKGSPQTVAELILENTTFQNTLPQGAPTSPFLFYLVMTEGGLFSEIQSLCSHRWKTSCYVDNIVISGPKPPSSKTMKQIFDIIEKHGFKVNKRKTRLVDCRQGAVLICGVNVNNDGEIRLPKRKVREIRGRIYRATFNPTPDTIRQIQGLVGGFLKPIYGKKLPPQIAKPYSRFLKACARFKRTIIVEQARLHQAIVPLETKQTRLTKWM